MMLCGCCCCVVVLLCCVEQVGDDVVWLCCVVLLCCCVVWSRLVVQLSSVVSSLRDQAAETLNTLTHFSTLWNQDPEEQVQVFLRSDPSLTEFSSQISFYSTLEGQILDLPGSCSVGPVLFGAEQLKLALTHECRLWKRAFGAALNRRAAVAMDTTFSLLDGLTKRLQRPITDLEDVRGAMAALSE
ncbi:dynein heavy chain 5, axonemal-like, partial [Etheostoma cragini]|uniref:dynein heavy chain 5, axonemal-like n=1 Tax=Etheostoma cragini TaxID=417921 RepID=UPI00155ED286